MATRTSQSRIWFFLTIVMTFVAVCLLIALIAVAVSHNNDDDDDSNKNSASSSSSAYACGSARNGNTNYVKVGEDPNPGPFHDLTKAEMAAVRKFLETSPEFGVYKADTDPADTLSTKAAIMAMDLLPAPKAQVVSHLDSGGSQPPRFAQVFLYRPDLSPKVVEERACGPLPDVTSCQLLDLPHRRNPVEESLAPRTIPEFIASYLVLVHQRQLDATIGPILMKSFGAKFTGCDQGLCLDTALMAIPTAAHGDINVRANWMTVMYKLEGRYLRMVDLYFLVTQPSLYEFVISEVWYGGTMFTSVQDFVAAYNNGSVTPIRQAAPQPSTLNFATMNRRGPFSPERPLRPPTLVEPDGRRFTVNYRRVTYLGWQFDFQMSTTRGPALHDVRYKGERIAYELSLQELSVFYSGSDFMRTFQLADSGLFLGFFAKGLIEGTDCPNTAVYAGAAFASMTTREPDEIKRIFCIFEQNDGIPLVRHHDYDYMKFYSGMLDSHLVFRTALSVGNYDYIIDFLFHQNGVLDVRATSTGYILTSVWQDASHAYGHRLRDKLLGNLHHHIFSFKADLDIKGTSNTYETLDMEEETFNLQTGVPYAQTKMTRRVKKTEQQALYKYNFNRPKYHLVYNNASRTGLGEAQAYRISMNGVSKQLLSKGKGSEQMAPWARNQMVVTRHKDSEQTSSSPYAMWDSADPVNDFTTFYSDNEGIENEDLVFWLTMGVHHIPHTEDFPVTSTSATRLSFSLLPHNYFSECPSVESRDSIRLQAFNPGDPNSSIAVIKYGKSDAQCTTTKSKLKDDIRDDPLIALKLN